jgi:hypothetical protein
MQQSAAEHNRVQQNTTVQQNRMVLIFDVLNSILFRHHFFFAIYFAVSITIRTRSQSTRVSKLLKTLVKMFSLFLSITLDNYLHQRQSNLNLRVSFLFTHFPFYDFLSS